MTNQDVNQDLVKYIETQVKNNKKEQDIINELKETGWDYVDIAKALKYVKKKIRIKKLVLLYSLAFVIVVVAFLLLGYFSSLTQNLYTQSTDKNKINLGYNFSDSKKTSLSLDNISSCYGNYTILGFFNETESNITRSSFDFNYSVNFNQKLNNSCIFTISYYNINTSRLDNLINHSSIDFDLKQQLLNLVDQINNSTWQCNYSYQSVSSIKQIFIEQQFFIISPAFCKRVSRQ